MATQTNKEETKPRDDQLRLLPFLKWAGGKRWLVRDHIDLFPKTYNQYIEPFLGGGSIFFALRPSKAILADSNARLIEAYIQIRDNPKYIAKLLRQHQARHSDSYYYSVRKRIHPRSAAQRAAQFIYLNRTCWNGLYRVNLKGQFNVPRGTKSSVLLNTDDFDSLSVALQGTEILTQDFAVTLSRAGPGDFVYIDPPYTVKHKFNAFIKYNENIFSWEDQIRLRDEVKLAADRGARVAVSNADHDSIRKLYSDIGVQITITRQSIIAANRRSRGSVDELLILSWKN